MNWPSKKSEKLEPYLNTGLFRLNVKMINQEIAPKYEVLSS